jgi:hypothetical protein
MFANRLARARELLHAHHLTHDFDRPMLRVLMAALRKGNARSVHMRDN